MNSYSMNSKLKRAAEHNEVMAMIAKPKPKKADRPKKRKTKTDRQKIVIRLDNLVREIVFMRDEFPARLVYSVKNTEMIDNPELLNHRGVDQPGHIISRGRIATRWGLNNVHKQDSNDNLLHNFYPEVYNQWYTRNFGIPAWNVLVNDSRVITKYSMDELETLEMELTEIQKLMADGWKPYFTQKDILAGLWKK